VPRSDDDIASLRLASLSKDVRRSKVVLTMTSENVRVGFGLVPLPLQQPRECHRGTPPHVWMVYCPNVDAHDGLNWPLFAAAGVAHDSGGLGGD